MRSYLFYLVLTQTVISNGLCVSSIFFNLQTLYIIFRLFQTKTFISLLVVAHIISWIVLASGWMINNSYLIALWDSTRIQYNPKIIFFSYFGILPCIPIPAVSLLFLTIERSLVFIYYSYQSMKRTQIFLVFITIFSSFIVYSFIAHGLVLDAPLRFSDSYVCVTPNCQTDKTDVDLRVNILTVILSIVILFALSILFYFVKATTFQSSDDKFATMVTINVVLVQSILDIFIHSCGFMATLYLQENPVNVIGCYIRPISSLNGFLCSIIYSKNIKRMKKRNEKIAKINESKIRAINSKNFTGL